MTIYVQIYVIENIGEIVMRLSVISLTVEPDNIRSLSVIVVLGVVILFIIELRIWVLVVLSLCFLSRSDIGLCACAC